jgi:GT2 family glycosyltransferase
MNSLSIIIPSKTRSNLESCIKAIRAMGETCRIIAVDDGLVDWEFGAGYEPFSILSGSKPFVFARNVNRGINCCIGDVIVLNDDALLQTPGGFTLLQKEAEEHPEFGCIGAVTNITGQPLQRPQGKGLREVPSIAFIAVLIPRRTIKQIGMLDERYCIDYGCEDADYCETIHRAGMKVGVHDGCYVDHASLVSTFRGDPRNSRSYAQNQELFNQKWGVV